MSVWTTDLPSGEMIVSRWWRLASEEKAAISGDEIRSSVFPPLPSGAT